MAPKRDTRSAWLAVGPAFAHNEFPRPVTGQLFAAGIGVAGAWEVTVGGAYFGVNQVDVDSVGFAFTLADMWLGAGLTLPLSQHLHWRTQVAPSVALLDHHREGTTSQTSGGYHDDL